MKNRITTIALILVAFSFGFIIHQVTAKQPVNDYIYQSKTTIQMKLGAFSVSLNVKDLQASKVFYEKLGFTVFGGALEQKYLIMKNENALIGLFEGMFEGNILTFNPGWDENAHNLAHFDDIREIQKQLKDNKLELISSADETTTGPASLMLSDPDGNVILMDQHR
jgi:catechol 2,3-dioxygenase-like lactoylglutathione lyase family enzyme